MTKIIISIPKDQSGRSLYDYFRSLISSESGDVGGELSSALNLDMPDRRATVDSVDIDDVDVQCDGVQVDYTVHHSTYNGCRDMLGEDSYSEAIFGKLVGETWVFDEHQTPEPLSPNEEL